MELQLICENTKCNNAAPVLRTVKAYGGRLGTAEIILNLSTRWQSVSCDVCVAPGAKSKRDPPPPPQVHAGH